MHQPVFFSAGHPSQCVQHQPTAERQLLSYLTLLP
jgi:hypothetical protein